MPAHEKVLQVRILSELKIILTESCLVCIYSGLQYESNYFRFTHLICQDDLKMKSDYIVLFQDLVMDILRVLSAPDLEVRKKTLTLALDLVSSRNIEEVRRLQI